MRKMKRYLSIVACLLVVATTAMAGNNVLVIHMKSGTMQRYVLRDDNPTISFTGDNVVVTTTSTESVYALEDVGFFNYENTTTGIGAIEKNSAMLIEEDHISFNGLPVGSKVFVYGVGGQLYLTETADADGNAAISLSSLASGVYVVKANHISTKITKK